MEDVIETIRAAVAAEASPEHRAAGATACRAILAVLEPQAAAAPSTAAPGQPPQIPIAAIAAALRGQSPDVLLDLAIAKLRALVPDAPKTTTKVLRMPILPPLRMP